MKSTHALLNKDSHVFETHFDKLRATTELRQKVSNYWILSYLNSIKLRFIFLLFLIFTKTEHHWFTAFVNECMYIVVVSFKIKYFRRKGESLIYFKHLEQKCFSWFNGACIADVINSDQRWLLYHFQSTKRSILIYFF